MTQQQSQDELLWLIRQNKSDDANCRTLSLAREMDWVTVRDLTWVRKILPLGNDVAQGPAEPWLSIFKRKILRLSNDSKTSRNLPAIRGEFG
jgi:hypothetical protein